MGFEWSTSNHERCRPEIQTRVMQLLLIQQRTRCIHKHVWIHYIIPACIGQVINPVFYVGERHTGDIERSGRSLLQGRLEDVIGPVVSLTLHTGFRFINYALVEFRLYQDAMYAKTKCEELCMAMLPMFD